MAYAWLAALLLALVLHPPPSACYCIGSPFALDDASAFDIVILDPDEAPESLVESLQAQGSLVLAYINAGYAENWRWYWDLAAEAGIVHEAAGYEGEYLVEYWSPKWHDIILEYAERVLEAGYDGVYLDNVDAAAVLSEAGPPWAAGVDLNESMLDLVAEVSSLGAPVLVNLGSATWLVPGLAEAGVDGVLREETLYRLVGECTVEPVDPMEASEALAALRQARGLGLTVIMEEYVSNKAQAALVYAVALSLGASPVAQPACDPDYTRPPLTPPWEYLPAR